MTDIRVPITAFASLVARLKRRAEGGAAMTKRITQLVNSTLKGEMNNEETLTEEQVCMMGSCQTCLASATRCVGIGDIMYQISLH